MKTFEVTLQVVVDEDEYMREFSDTTDIEADVERTAVVGLRQAMNDVTTGQSLRFLKRIRAGRDVH